MEIDDSVLDFRVISNVVRLQQVVLNIISNSAKFTKQGSISILANIINDSDKPILVITIKDTGIGMKQDDVDKIIYSDTDIISLDTNKTYNQMGSGLGLSISKSLLKRLNHKFDIISKEGLGTEFRIYIDSIEQIHKCYSIREESGSLTIPYFELDNSRFDGYNSFINKEQQNERVSFSSRHSFIHHSKNKSEDLINLANKDCILIVEDNDQIRKACSSVLSKYIFKNKLDYCIVDCSDGVDMLYILRKDQENQNKIKIIITDENMEYMCGSTAIAIIRELEKFNKLKRRFISSLTAFTDENTIQMIKRKGSDVIIDKPLNSDKIDSLFQNYNAFNFVQEI